jgi:hypothetical protein
MRCPQCHNKILQKSVEGVKLRTKGPIQFDQNGACTAQCYWCGSPVQVPVQLSKSAEVESERFILRKVS